MKADPRLMERLLNEGEGDWIEFKQSWFDPQGVGRYVSALGNGARLADRPNGYLVWGVDDKGSVVGTTVDPRKRKVGKQPFEFWLKGRIGPKGHGLRFLDFEHDGHNLVILSVEAATGVPVRFDGIPYVRVGQATPPMEDHPDRETRLLQALVKTSFEDDLAVEQVTVEEAHNLLDVNMALRLLKQPEMTNPVEQMERLARFGLVEEVGGGFWAIRNRTAMLFARRLADFGETFERRTPRVIFYVGDTRARTRFEQDGALGYALGFEGLFLWLEGHLPRSEQLLGVLREDRPLYPVEALRELVANALIHQDFSIGGASPMIEIFDHRIEISNPGKPLIEVDRLMDEPPRSRNERLARLMRLIGYCEERGSGIDKVILQAEAYQLPSPAFEVKADGFVATMFAPRDFSEMTSEERIRACYWHACLLWVSGEKAMTNKSLRKRFGLPDSRTPQISRLIADALAAGVIRDANPTNRSRAQASYVPYWAG